MRLAFVDIETTGLDPARHEIWEVGYVIVDEGVEWMGESFQMCVDLEGADPHGLEVGRFHDRHCLGGTFVAWPIEDQRARVKLLRDLNGAVLIGNNVAFDADFLRRFLGSAPWHYHVVDVKALVAGRLLAERPSLVWRPPWSTVELLEAADLPPFKAHSALDDAKQAKALYDWATRG